MRIIVEGHTDKDFFYLYCKYLKLDVKIYPTEGKDKLKSQSETLKRNDDETNLIIFDADNNYNNLKTNIENQINQLNIPKKNYEIFLLPNDKDSGNLETLIEKIAVHKEILNCFDSYTKCIEGLKNKNESLQLPTGKDKVFAYMQSFGFNNRKSDKFDLSPYVDFENEYLDPLKNFLLKNYNSL